MKKTVILRVIAAFMCFVCLLSNIALADTDTAKEPEYLSYYRPRISTTQFSLDKQGKCKVDWETNYQNDEVKKIVYELELSKSKNFESAQKLSSDTTSIAIDKSKFGTNGGQFYIRVKTNITLADGKSYSTDWSDVQSFAHWNINKTNFSGIYNLLKYGSKAPTLDGSEDVVYDKNSDGWLDNEEIINIYSISTVAIPIMKNGKYVSSKPSKKLSSLKGIEKLSYVSSVNIAHYSGKKLDLSKNKQMRVIFVDGVTATSMTVVSPTAKDISIKFTSKKKISKVDFSQCPKVRVLDVIVTLYGTDKPNNTKLVLPKNKTELKVLSFTGFKMKTVDLNAYKKLNQVYVYSSSLDKIKVNKCKDLHYLYFYCSYKIKSVDVRPNKKLKGIDVCYTPSLKLSKVKKNKSTKLTKNTGKWWYGTKFYKNEMQRIYA